MRMIYLSPVPWASFSQRPHHFVHWYHDLTAEPVLWIDPYPTRLPSLNDFTRRPSVATPQHFSVPPWLQLCNPLALPIEPMPGSALILKLLWRNTFRTVAQFAADGPCMICVGKPSELALQLLKRLPDRYAVYDAMDDFPAFYQGLSRRSMGRRQAQLIRRVSRVLASSTPLHDRLQGVANHVELALNACDLQHLAPVEHLDLGAKQQVLGYVGTMGHWFDWELVAALARANPANPVRLIGPVFTPAPCALPANVELIPECAHADAIAAMATFSVGLIPFKLTPLTASVDPIKYYEYRALGLPVISTCFGEMALRSQAPGVWLVEGDTDLRQTAVEALNCPSDHSTIRQFRQDNLWANRFAATQVCPKR
ncbi:MULTISPECIES: glycosyl transferase [Pseudomonas]|uniref:glycosyl transferase n=1 Tax=Pseudomonas TaxID=286 RepID=UPI001BEB64CD|nr:MULTISPECIES: glycosyl transferase [Pseudomonas]MBT2338993.1 glycosyl transferase [Pseudomonas fluorescens]MCD4527778.1 glycosyl transferase [Pseudomonas sp. C3-2018]